MNNVPLPALKPQRSGRDILDEFLASDAPELPSDPDARAAFTEALYEIANAPDSVADQRAPDTLSQAPESIAAKSARARGGRVGDGGIGGLVDGVADFVGGLPFDAGQAIARGVTDGSAAKTLGGIGMLAASAFPGGMGLTRAFMRSKVADDAVSLGNSALGTKLTTDPRWSTTQFANANGALDMVDAARNLPATVVGGAAAGAGTGVATGLTQDGASLADIGSAAVLGAGIGGGSARAGAHIGRAAGHRVAGQNMADTIGGVGVSPDIVRARLDATGDALEARLPVIEQQSLDNLALEDQLQRLAIDTEHKLQKKTASQQSREKLQAQASQRPANEKRRKKKPAKPKANMLQRLEKDGGDRIQAAETYGKISPRAAQIALSDIGAKAAKTKAAAATRKPDPVKKSAPKRETRERNENISPALVQGMREKLKIAGLGTARQRSANPKKARQILSAYAKENGVSEGFLRRQLTSKAK